MFCVGVNTFDWNLFQSAVRLNPNFNCCCTFTLQSVDKVITGTWGFVSVITNIGSWFEGVLDDITQFWDQVGTRLI